MNKAGQKLQYMEKFLLKNRYDIKDFREIL